MRKQRGWGKAQNKRCEETVYWVIIFDISGTTSLGEETETECSSQLVHRNRTGKNLMNLPRVWSLLVPYLQMRGFSALIWLSGRSPGGRASHPQIRGSVVRSPAPTYWSVLGQDAEPLIAPDGCAFHVWMCLTSWWAGRLFVKKSPALSVWMCGMGEYWLVLQNHFE